MHAIMNMRIESSASVTIGDVIKCPEISYHTISIDVIYKGLIENKLSLNTNSNGFGMTRLNIMELPPPSDRSMFGLL